MARFLRLVRKARGIRRLLFTLVYSLPALVNVGALLFLIIYIYCILGISLFGHVKHTGALNSENNFETFIDAFYLLFQLSTAAAWNEVLEPTMIQPPDCDANFNNYSNGNCGYPIIAPIYFSSFVAISFLIIVNMYIAIILDNFVETIETGVSGEDIKAFYETWARFDPTASQFVGWHQLVTLIRQIPQPLGKPNADLAFVGQLDIPIFEGNRAHCLDVVNALVHSTLTATLGDVEDNNEMDKVMAKVKKQFSENFPTRAAQTQISSTKEIASAGFTVLKAVRRFTQLRRARLAAKATLTSATLEPQRISSVIRHRDRSSTLTKGSIAALAAMTTNPTVCAVAVPDSSQLLDSLGAKKDQKPSVERSVSTIDPPRKTLDVELNCPSTHSLGRASTHSKTSADSRNRYGWLPATLRTSNAHLPSDDPRLSTVC